MYIHLSRGEDVFVAEGALHSEERGSAAPGRPSLYPPLSENIRNSLSAIEILTKAYCSGKKKLGSNRS